MNAEERFERIEGTLQLIDNILAGIADNRQKLDSLLSVLAESQIRLAEAPANHEA